MVEKQTNPTPTAPAKKRKKSSCSSNNHPNHIDGGSREGRRRAETSEVSVFRFEKGKKTRLRIGPGPEIEDWEEKKKDRFRPGRQHPNNNTSRRGKHLGQTREVKSIGRTKKEKREKNTRKWVILDPLQKKKKKKETPS